MRAQFSSQGTSRSSRRQATIGRSLEQCDQPKTQSRARSLGVRFSYPLRVVRCQAFVDGTCVHAVEAIVAIPNLGREILLQIMACCPPYGHTSDWKSLTLSVWRQLFLCFGYAAKMVGRMSSSREGARESAASLATAVIDVLASSA